MWRQGSQDSMRVARGERYKHLNAEFQRIARRDKKAFLSDQCKEIEENNRMGRSGNLPETQVQRLRDATREESGVLGFPSRRGLTPRGSLECEDLSLCEE